MRERTWSSIERDKAHFRADYFMWCAKRGTPLGRLDPATGNPYYIMDIGAWRIGRAAYSAAAREAYALARSYPLPLP